MPWGYFDGAARGALDRCGGGSMLHFDLQNYLYFKAGFGEGTNNFAELSALIFLMSKNLEWGVQMLQIFGDSKIIINWANGFQRCHFIRLVPLLDEVLLLKQHFDFISFTYVYRERNTIANRLSKEGAQLQEGQDSVECFLRDLGGFYHRPFREQDIVDP